VRGKDEHVAPETPGENPYGVLGHRDGLGELFRRFCSILVAGEYHLPMLTPGFRRMLEAGLWFVVGFIVHWALVHFHNHP
jgi:hypothetical protein